MEPQYFAIPGHGRLIANTYNPRYVLPDDWVASLPEPGNSPSSAFCDQYYLSAVIVNTGSGGGDTGTRRAAAYIFKWAHITCTDAERERFWPVLAYHNGSLQWLFGYTQKDWPEAHAAYRQICPSADEWLLRRLWVHLKIVEEVNTYRHWASIVRAQTAMGRIDITLHKIFRDYKGRAFVKPKYPRDIYGRKNPRCYSWYAPEGNPLLENMISWLALPGPSATSYFPPRIAIPAPSTTTSHETTTESPSHSQSPAHGREIMSSSDSDSRSPYPTASTADEAEESTQSTPTRERKVSTSPSGLELDARTPSPQSAPPAPGPLEAAAPEAVEVDDDIEDECPELIQTDSDDETESCVLASEAQHSESGFAGDGGAGVVVELAGRDGPGDVELFDGRDVDADVGGEGDWVVL